METKPKPRGGPRPGSGRPYKPNKDAWGQITCVLKKDTIAALKSGAASKHFGDFLQAHLDRYPLPSREMYLALQSHQPIMMEIRRRKMPVIISAGGSVNRIRPRHAVRHKRLSNKEFEKAIVAAGS